MDEEEIIRRRDGVIGAAHDEALDSDAKRALADARLRALAFALGSEESRNAEAGQTDDSELVAYLLDTLPEHRRMALEEALRGNARALGRLMTVRTALSLQADKRDRQRANDPARKISRHIVGRFNIRSVGEVLQFKEASVRPRGARSLEPRSFVAERAEFPPASARFRARKRERPRLRLNPKTAVLFAAVLKRVMMDFHTVGDLVGEMQSLLSRWEESIRREPSEKANEEAEQLEERLLDSLRRLEMRAHDAQEELARIVRDDFESTQRISSLRLRVLERSDTELLDQLSRFDADSWVDAVNVEAGPWALHLAGTAVPKPQLGVSLLGNQLRTPSVDPFLTMVRPGEGFETVNLDSSGSGKVALPDGESVMLLQGDAVWEVRLSFNDGQET
jgi:hypothetical protein